VQPQRWLKSRRESGSLSRRYRHTIVASAITNTPYKFMAAQIRLFRHPVRGNAYHWSEYRDLNAIAEDELKIDHCWAECIENDQLIADFSTWQLREYFEGKWEITDWQFAPAYFWGYLNEVPSPYLAWYEYWCDVTKPVCETIANERKSTLQAIVRHAFRLLEEKGYPRIRADDYWPEWLIEKRKPTTSDAWQELDVWEAAYCGHLPFRTRG
jgi:hypothetical protein